MYPRTQILVTLVALLGCQGRPAPTVPTPVAPLAAEPQVGQALAPAVPVSPSAAAAAAMAEPASPAAEPAGHAVLPAATATVTDSLYLLPAKLQDQDGKSLGLDGWKGQPTLVAMFYANCPQACPLLIQNVKAVLAAVPEPARAQVRVLLVSMEPTEDTPEVLRGVMTKHGLDAAQWRLVRADEDTVRDIAAVLGIAYKKLDDGSYNHSSLITLLDGQGKVAAREDGLRPAKDALAGVAAKLAIPAP